MHSEEVHCLEGETSLASGLGNGGDAAVVKEPSAIEGNLGNAGSDGELSDLLADGGGGLDVSTGALLHLKGVRSAESLAVNIVNNLKGRKGTKRER